MTINKKVLDKASTTDAANSSIPAQSSVLFGVTRSGKSTVAALFLTSIQENVPVQVSTASNSHS